MKQIYDYSLAVKSVLAYYQQESDSVFYNRQDGRGPEDWTSGWYFVDNNQRILVYLILYLWNTYSF